MISFLIYILMVFGFVAIIRNYSDNTSYTDNQSVVKLIQGSILSESELNRVENKPSFTSVNQQSMQEVKTKVYEDQTNPKQSNQTLKEEYINDSFDPFESIDIDLKPQKKDNTKQKIDAKKLEAINKAIDYANKSISNIEDISNIKQSVGEKKGNAKENAMPGKYDKYKGMVNRILNEIWGLYRPQNQNMVKVKVRINSSGFMEVISYDRVESEDFMSNINKFFDKIQGRNFGVPPNGEEMVLDILLQTNENKQGIVVE